MLDHIIDVRAVYGDSSEPEPSEDSEFDHFDHGT
jgi:hypothetical protein